MPKDIGAAARAACSSIWIDPTRAMFASPEPAGRSVVCGLSHLQRIGKGATTDVWFPQVPSADGGTPAWDDPDLLESLNIEWAAVRQFEIMQEGENIVVENLKVTNFRKAFYRALRMRGGGYRVTLITLGRYDNVKDQDDLNLLDQRLQETITGLVHMLYLEEESASMSQVVHRALQNDTWSVSDALPHLAATLGAMSLFGRGPSHAQRQKRLTEKFVLLLDLLAQNKELRGKAQEATGRTAQKRGKRGRAGGLGGGTGGEGAGPLVHDVTVGLSLPQARARKNWVYIPRGEMRFSMFQEAIRNVFQAFDLVNIGALQGREGPVPYASADVTATMGHMRAYGDRGRDWDDHYRSLARCAMG